MNVVFVSGKIISKIEFKFIINSKNISIATFFMQFGNNIIKVIAYDEIADYIYKKFKIKDNVCIFGKLKKNILEIVEMCLV